MFSSFASAVHRPSSKRKKLGRCRTNGIQSDLIRSITGEVGDDRLPEPSSLHDHNTALASLGTAESYGMRQGDGEAECAEASWVLDVAKNLCATEGTSAGMSDVVSMFCLSVGCQRTRS